uniref:Secreted protein n=1 Tax=Salarias fasciatus TaxID=181472 RepID=A0A672J0Z8_SALFA
MRCLSTPIHLLFGLWLDFLAWWEAPGERAPRSDVTYDSQQIRSELTVFAWELSFGGLLKKLSRSCQTRGGMRRPARRRSQPAILEL